MNPKPVLVTQSIHSTEIANVLRCRYCRIDSHAGKTPLGHQEQFFDQRLKTLRPIDHRYPYEVHNKAMLVPKDGTKFWTIQKGVTDTLTRNEILSFKYFVFEAKPVEQWGFGAFTVLGQWNVGAWKLGSSNSLIAANRENIETRLAKSS